MSRNFNGSTDHITGASTPVTAVPLTIAAWIRHEAAGNDAMVSINDNTANAYAALMMTSSVRPSWRIRSGGVTTALGPSDISTNTWYHVVGREVSSSSHFCYIDGVAGTEETDTRGLPTVNDVSVGRLGDSTPSNQFDGDIAEVGIWNVALTAAEIASLADGAVPPMVRPDALVYYMPLTRQTHELIGNVAQTVSGTTVNVGPPKVLRRAGQLIQFPPAATGTTYFQTNTGLLVPVGTMLRETQKVTSGSVTPTSTIVRDTQKQVSGEVTPTGALSKLVQFANTLAGTVTPSGVLNAVKVVVREATARTRILIGRLMPGGM